MAPVNRLMDRLHSSHHVVDICHSLHIQTVGLLYRRHVSINGIKYIGKESNSLEDVESGLIHDQRNVYTEYPDRRRDEWQTKILPALRDTRLADLVRHCKGYISRRALIDLRAGRSRPHRKNQEILLATLRQLGRG